MAEGVSAHFAEDGARAIAAATEAARTHHAAEVTSEHLLAGLLQHADGELAELLAPYGLTADTATRRIMPARPDDPVIDAPVFSRRAKQILRIAHSQGENRIGCAGIFLGLVLCRDRSVLAFLRDNGEFERLTSAAWALAGVSSEPVRRRPPPTTPAS